MAGKREKLDQSAKTFDRFEVTLFVVTKHVTNNLGIKLPKPQPDLTKIEQSMTKSRKPAEFFLSLDRDVFSLELVIGSETRILAQVSLAAEKDISKRRAVLQGLAQNTSLVTKADLDAFDKAHPDPRAVADLQKQIEEKKADLQRIQFLMGEIKGLTFDHSTPALWGGLKNWAVKHSVLHYLDFIEAIDGQVDAKSIIERYVRKGAQFPVNLHEQVRLALEHEAAAGTPPNFAPARKEIVHAIDSNIIPKYKAETLGVLQKKLDQTTKELAALAHRLKELGGG
jgi:hypothetical protein